MSFDVFFVALGAEKDAPLPAADARALGAVMQEHGGPAAPDQYGYFFELSDGGGVEFYAGRRVGGMLALRGLTPELGDFIFDVLSATGWVAAFPSDELVFLSAQEVSAEARRRADLPSDARFVVVRSGEDVERALADAFGGWEQYRDHVIRTIEGR